MIVYYCKICATTGPHRSYTVKEMMFGISDAFTYFICDHCGCLQQSSVPTNLSDYYPDHYYSFASVPPVTRKSRIKKWLYHSWITYLLTGKSFSGKILAWIKRKNIPVYSIFRKAGFAKKKRILDVGSGNGWLLHPLVDAGFSNIKGIDPYIKETIRYENGLEILKTDLLVLEDIEWDIIMFNHSFEHLDAPLSYLQRTFHLLSNDGICLLRLPTVSSGAWETYMENWAQLDAPRHMFLHSIQSLSLLADSAGFTIVDIIQETSSFSVIASEQYLRNIPMYGDERSYFEGNTKLFTAKELNFFLKKQFQWEKEARADSIAVILKKRNNTK